MKARDIMDAMDMLDADIILDAKAPQTGRRLSLRRILLVAAVVVLAGSLGISALAAADKAGWFRDMFADKAGSELTPGQESFIRDNTVDVGMKQTRNGYTLTLDSAVTDGKLAYFRFLLTAQEGTKLDADWYGANYGTTMLNEAGENFLSGEGSGAGGMRWITEPEGRQEDRVWLLLETDRSFFGDAIPLSDHIWTVYIYGLKAGYPQEDLGLRYETLAEGCWEFQIRFPEGCERELELIREPVTTSCVLDTGRTIDMEAGVIYVTTEACPVQITSFRLRALTAELTFAYPEKDQINGRFGDIYVVMKDGTKIRLTDNSVMPNFLSYTLEAPVDLDQADHILFPDGTTIPVESGS